ncbi:MAG: ABC transporter ATP-binding protein [Treponema sp.]|jgi:NitT/TauT family transport system ATP-binding protein|nr:ABC transporter ATP-binding protein [Treponema sp.]
MDNILITIKNVHKEYRTGGPSTVALMGVDLEIKENEFVCVVGPSGCGKSTLLNIIAGLEHYDSGEVKMSGEDIVGPGPDRGVIFQQYALFPWMTVRKNIEYGMKFIRKENRGKHYTRGEKRKLADHYIKMVNLEGFEDAYPKALSGGMKQRAAIARGYAVNPRVLLMDEPFGALDAQTRAQLQEELLLTWEREKKTCFFITHDVEEAVLLASRVIIMSARPGKVMEIVNIDLPYPRNQSTKLDSLFIDYRNHIWDTVYKMYLEVRK